jgi:hypothetical protein
MFKKANLQRSYHLLPGMKSPTVLPLAESGWVSGAHGNRRKTVLANDRKAQKCRSRRYFGKFYRKDVLIKMHTYNYPKKEQWADITKRPTASYEDLYPANKRDI